MREEGNTAHDLPKIQKHCAPALGGKAEQRVDSSTSLWKWGLLLEPSACGQTTNTQHPSMLSLVDIPVLLDLVDLIAAW